MSEVILPPQTASAVAVHPIAEGAWEAFAARAPRLKAAGVAARFVGKAGQIALARDAEGGLEAVLFGLGGADNSSEMSWRALAAGLPPGDYRIEGDLAGADPGRIALAWALGAYRFDRYKARRGEAAPRLVAPPGADLAQVLASAHACALARDMINTPANDMGPRQIETIAREIAEAFGAQVTVVAGDDLIEAGYPAVHAVGRAAVAERAPRMIEIAWGEADRPLVALVGKGVVFDSGGLDIKPSAGMRLMKKDMGGAAHALALGRMIMGARLPVRLCVLIPAV
jgi:leucyl aminopeptidase